MSTRYEFRVQGDLSDEARALFGDMRITTVPPQTVLEGEVLDESQLYGIIAQLHALGITVVSVQPDPG